MEVHNALHLALIGVRRRNDQAPVQADKYSDQCQGAKDAFSFLFDGSLRGHSQLSITQSKINTPTVKNITSKPMSRRNQGEASPIAPTRMMSSMQRIVASITGIISGNSTSGSKSSRARALRVIADMIVPNTQKPIVPSKLTRNSCGSKFHEGKLKRIQNNGMTTISTTIISSKLKPLLARKKAPRSSGEMSSASRQWFSRSG